MGNCCKTIPASTQPILPPHGPTLRHIRRKSKTRSRPTSSRNGPVLLEREFSSLCRPEPSVTSAGKLHFVQNGATERLDDEASQKLMLPLLDYLYTHPGKGRPVLSIIRAFVREYFPQCRPRDFQRTATDVLRIEANVRFAAHKLRKIGLLQFSEVEAFKTWRLSLLGILAGNHYSDGNYDPQEAVPTSFWLFTIPGRLEPMRNAPTLVSLLRLANWRNSPTRGPSRARKEPQIRDLDCPDLLWFPTHTVLQLVLPSNFDLRKSLIIKTMEARGVEPLSL